MVHSPPRADVDAAAEDPSTSSAIRRHEERLARDPGSLAFAALADAYRKAGRSRQAIELCREGLRRFPEYATARLILAKALRDGGDPEGALAEVRLILERNPADAQAHRLAGELERAVGRISDAVAHLRQAVALDPSDRESRQQLEMLDGATRSAGNSALQRLLADDTFATISFGTLCLNQGLTDEAAQVFLRILRREPGHGAARRKLDETLRVKTQRRKGS